MRVNVCAIMQLRVHVRASVCMRARCMRRSDVELARERASVRAYEFACACVRVRACVCVRMCTCVYARIVRVRAGGRACACVCACVYASCVRVHARMQYKYIY